MASEPTLPLDEFLGDKRRLKAYARRVGRPDLSLTVDEYMAWAQQQGTLIGDGSKLREILTFVATGAANHPAGLAGYRRDLVIHAEELIEHSGSFAMMRDGLTPEQLARIPEISCRMRAISDELLSLEREVEGWVDGPLPRDDFEPADELPGKVYQTVGSIACGTTDEALELLRDLRVTQGRRGFVDWWECRIRHLGAGLEHVRGDDATPSRHRRFTAVDVAVAKRDPELGGWLDSLVASSASDRRGYLTMLGITEAQLVDRAAGVIADLIDSGWRP